MKLYTIEFRKLLSGGFIAAVFVFFSVFPVDLRAQDTADITCTGDYCSKLPYSDSELDSILYGLQQNYARLLFNDMAEAAVMANMAGVPIGTINLEKFAIGGSVSAGYKPVHYETVVIPNVTTVDNLPVAGAAIIPKFYVGVNIGSLFGLNYDPYADPEDYENEEDMPVRSPSILSPLRFDLYLSYAKLADDYNVPDSEVSIDFDSRYQGAELRYHLLEGGDILAGPMLRFRGLSVGIGMYKSWQNFDITQANSNMDFPASTGASVVWEGTDSIKIRHNIDSYTFDVRSGVQLFYLLNLSAGVGVASNKGASEFTLSRTGPVSLVADPAMLALLQEQSAALPAGTELPAGMDTSATAAQLQELINNGTIQDAAVMTMYMKGNGDIPKTLVYGRLGVELNAWVVKVSVEAIATKKSYAANLGVRVEF